MEKDFSCTVFECEPRGSGKFKVICSQCGHLLKIGRFCVGTIDGDFLLKDMFHDKCSKCGQGQDLPKIYPTKSQALIDIEYIKTRLVKDIFFMKNSTG